MLKEDIKNAFCYTLEYSIQAIKFYLSRLLELEKQGYFSILSLSKELHRETKQISFTVFSTDRLESEGFIADSSNDEVVLPDGVRFWLVKRGTGKVHPALGDLVGIRFRAKYGDYVFDDIMESEQPYYLRIGSNIVIQGVEEVLPLMNVGDLVHIVVPSNAAFGSKGRRASPGKRAIPPNATIEYDLELAELPGKEDFTPEVLDSP
ncbi:hypothetical protein Gasu2_19740 [Galdieria sulphuraria]|nr:hypothetical protein Gasu2_19740 [Galdieria sulphuraria]